MHNSIVKGSSELFSCIKLPAVSPDFLSKICKLFKQDHFDNHNVLNYSHLQMLCHVILYQKPFF